MTVSLQGLFDLFSLLSRVLPVCSCIICAFVLTVYQTCQLTILDDEADPQVEGDETFTVFLSSAVSSNLVQPYTAVVHIQDDSLDGRFSHCP